MIYPEKGSKFRSIENGKIVEFVKALNDGKKSIIVKDDKNRQYKISLDDLMRNFEDVDVPSNSTISL